MDDHAEPCGIMRNHDQKQISAGDGGLVRMATEVFPAARKIFVCRPA